jgi:outer membrane lipoprotein-sorting protein
MNSFLAFTALAVVQATPHIGDSIQANLRDATFRINVAQGVQRELNKINKDFGQSYRFKYTDVQLKEPFMMRLESVVEDTNVLMIINGHERMFRVPRARLVDRQNLAKAPGKRQTLLDFGLLTPSLFRDLFEAKFVRVDRAAGDLVFDLTFQDRIDTSRHRVWIDKDKRIVNRREWYNQQGRQLATFTYENPQQVSGVWFPTRCVVRNMDNQVAGVTQYVNIRVNAGIADSVFAIR